MRRMTLQIHAPISDPDEVAPLVEAGASRLYCGLSPAAWTRRFTRAVWLSRRAPSADLPDVRALAALVAAAHDRGVGVDLALNAPAFTAEQIPMVAGLALRAVRELGVQAVIVADTALMLALGEAGVPFIASTVAVAHNVEALSLFRDLGAVGAVLPRHLRLWEVRTIAREMPELALESLVLEDRCAWEEGLCRTTHAVPGVVPLCAVPWRRDVRFLRGASSPEEREAWTRVFERYAGWLSASDACGAPGSGGALPVGACGLCALQPLSAAGVRVLKLAGRQASLARRMRGVRLIRAVLDTMESGANEEAARARAIALRGTPEACAAGDACYFPEVRSGRQRRPSGP